MKEIMKKLEYLIHECGGEYGFNHSRRLIKLVGLIADGPRTPKKKVPLKNATIDSWF